MHRRAEYNGILVNLDTLSIGQLERWLRENPQANSEKVKQVKRQIRLSKDEEAE